MDRWLYLRYRANLRNIKPTTKQGREIHQLERIMFSWPARAYVWWVHAKHKYRAGTTPTSEPPTGGFLVPENAEKGARGA